VDKIFVGQPLDLGRGGFRLTKTTMTSRTFRIFWIANNEFKQTTITTKEALLLAI
jgi:hypothetical protein